MQLCRDGPSSYFVCVSTYVCVYACLVFMGWQESPEQGAQHGEKWARIERVPARPYKLDQPAGKKAPRQLLLEMEVAPSQMLVAPIFCALITLRPGSSTAANNYVYSHTLCKQSRYNQQFYCHVLHRTHGLSKSCVFIKPQWPVKENY